MRHNEPTFRDGAHSGLQRITLHRGYALISVDVSTDDTYSRCTAHAERDRRFSVKKQEQRLGYAGNCNYLLAQASSETTMFAFHDDILAPSCVERLSAALATTPRAALAFCDMEMTTANGEMQRLAFTALEGAASPITRGLIMLSEPHGWWVPNRGLFRTDAARRVQGVKRHLAGDFACDWPWLFHLSLLGEFIRVPETLCFKFLQKESLSRSWSYSAEQWLAVYASCMREIWQSDLDENDKLVLTQALLVQSRSRMGRYTWLPQPVRAAGRKLLPPALLRWL